MLKLKICLVFMIFAAVFSTTKAQEIIATDGKSTFVGDTHVSYTIGEPVIGTRSVGNNVVTQGYNQPEIEIISVKEEKMNPQLGIQIYPNPTHDYVNITPQNFETGSFMVQIFTVGGQKVLEESFEEAGIKLDVSSLVSSNYILNVTNAEENYNHNFKLVKSF